MKRTLSIIIAAMGLLLVVLAGQGAASAQADDASQVEAGKTVYESNCAGCHADDGTGVAGRGRPLLGIAEQGDRGTHIASITDGKGGMPAFGERLTSEEIEQATSYVRLTFLAAEEEAAATADEPELALTGVGSTGLAIIGMTMLIGGLQLVVWSRRSEG